MADKRIQDLTPASSVQTSDRFVLEQSGQAKSLTGQILINDLAAALDGHGGISNITYTYPVSPSLDGTITITLVDETEYSLAVTNGRGITNITWESSGTAGDGATHTGTISYNDGTDSTVTFQDGVKGDQGLQTYVWFMWADIYPSSDADMHNNVGAYIGIYSGISSTAPTHYTDYVWYQYKGETGDTGASIQSITKVSTLGLVDTYQVLLTNGNTTNFTVTNAKSIVSVTMTSGSHAAGTTDIYTITFNDGDTATFSVYNGANGLGSVSTVSGIQADGNGDVPQVISGNGAPTTGTIGQANQLYYDLNNSVLYYCVGESGGTYVWQGAGVTVDSALSGSSTNPVQNAVITNRIGTGALPNSLTELTAAINYVEGEIPSAATTTPLVDVTGGAIGTGTAFAKNDHQHPLNVATSGTPEADGTASLGTATTYAKTDHVHPLNVATSGTPAMDGTAALGSASTYARSDHVHPHDTLIVRENLLDNWYFVGGGSQLGHGVFPINSRGATSYTGSKSYSIDRWYLYDGNCTVTLRSNGLKIAKSSGSWFTITQYIENQDMYIGKKVTLSVLFEGTASTNGFSCRLIDIPTSGNPTTIISTGGTSTGGLHSNPGTISSISGKLAVSFYSTVNATSDVIVKAIKLEVGDTQTLAHQENGTWVLNELPSFEDELIHCNTSTADSTDTYANHIISYDSPNPNLLDNWYFVGGGSQLGYGCFPINQRGQTSYTGTTYGIDRWKYSSSNENVNSNYVQIVSTGTGRAFFEQNFLEKKSVALRGKTATASVLLSDGTLVSGTGVITTTVGSGNRTNFTQSVNNVQLMYEAKSSERDSFIMAVSVGYTVNFVAAKLELGNTQTLAHQENGTWVLNEMPNFTEELTKCQSYYYKTNLLNTEFGTIGLGSADTATSFNAIVALPVTMVKYPTPSYTGSVSFQVGNNANTKASPSVSVYNMSAGSCQIHFSGMSGLTVGAFGYVFSQAYGYLALSAEPT